MIDSGSTSSLTVFVIDDDDCVRESIGLLLQSFNLCVKTFVSPREFLRAERPDGPSCLVLDIRLTECSGLDFQRQLAQANIDIPIIFMTGHGDPCMSKKAMNAGAIEFLVKPFRARQLLNAVQTALSRVRH